VIAAINGPAVGIGATMTLPMDVRLASDRARIGFVFGRLGIVPEACSTWFLPRIVGISRALEWVYCADILSAQEAYDGGLVRSVHPEDELLDAARGLARKFVAGRSPVATALARQMPQLRAAAPARGAPDRLAGDVLHQRRRRQGGRGGVPREARPGVHGAGVAAAVVPPLAGLSRGSQRTSANVSAFEP
jgi:enoyl-CoA hydratase/carnithine racemase